MGTVLYVKYNRTRRPEYQTYTKIIETEAGKKVVKGALTDAAKAYIAEFPVKYEMIKNGFMNLNPITVELKDESAIFPYVAGQSLASILEQEQNVEKRMLQMKGFLVRILEIRPEHLRSFEPTKEFVEFFGADAEQLRGMPAVQGTDIDLIFENIIQSNDGWNVIDYEWTFDLLIPVEFIKFRCLYYYYCGNCKLFEDIDIGDYLAFYDIGRQNMSIYLQMDDAFQQLVHGVNRKNIYTSRYKLNSHEIYRAMYQNQAIDDEIRDADKKNQEIVDKSRHIGNLEAMIEQKDAENVRLEQSIEERSHEIEEYAKVVADREIKIQQLMHERDQYESRLVDIQNSKIWRSTRVLRKVLNIPGCIRQHGIKYTIRYAITGKALSVYSKAQNKVDYTEFVLSEKERDRQKNTHFSKEYKFSILVPLYNTPEKFLREMIESVQNQTYGNWELCLADGSDDEHKEVGRICKSYKKQDKRILYKKLEKNGGISENTNACIEMASGDYIALFDHDDVLHEAALYECMNVIINRNADYIYTDEMTFANSIDNVVNVHYKPDFSPDTLRSYNYICHLSVFHRELLEKTGGFRSEFDGSQDYDMILRLTEQAKNIVHIQKVLYFWRAHKNSVAQDVSAKPYTLEAAKRALTEHLGRVGLEGEVTDSRIPSVYKVNYKINQEKKVSILIPNKDHVTELDTCIRSIIEKSTYKDYEIIIVENNSTEKETFDYYKEIQKKYSQIRVVFWQGEFNFSAINNYGFQYATGEYILLLNNDIEIITPSWLEEMIMFAQRNDVGAVGAMLYYPDNTIQHAGVILGIGGVAGHSHKYFKRGDYGYASRLALAQNLSAVTAACLMMRREIYEEVHGLDEAFKVAFNDVDLCMRIRELGYLIVFTPFAELYHYESKSRGLEDTKEKQIRFGGEVERFTERWSKQLEQGDPYYNPNLTLIREDFSVKGKDEVSSTYV